MIDYVKYKQLNWYGHIRRMPEERIPRRVWEWCPGRRGRGRPRNTWMQDIMTGMKAKGLEEEDGMTRMSGEGNIGGSPGELREELVT